MNKKIVKIYIILLLLFFIFCIPKAYATPGNSKFEDDAFYQAIIDNLNEVKFNNISNRDENYCVTDEELKSITALMIGKDSLEKKVKNMKGIEELTSLIYLEINYSKIETLDISKNVNLECLRVLNASNLDYIDFSNNVKLREIDLTYTHLSSLNIENCSELEVLRMGAGITEKSKITELDLSNCPNLYELNLWGNKLTTLDLSNNKFLNNVYVTDGTLENIILPENSMIEKLALYNNKISSLEDIVNLETSSELQTLFISENDIEDYTLLDDMEVATDIIPEKKYNNDVNDYNYYEQESEVPYENPKVKKYCETSIEVIDSFMKLGISIVIYVFVKNIVNKKKK